MDINVTRFMDCLGNLPHNQVNLGVDSATFSWNEAREATSKLKPLSEDEALALQEMFTRYGCEDVPLDKSYLMAMLRQELRCLQLEYEPESPEDGGNALYKNTETNQWWLAAN